MYSYTWDEETGGLLLNSSPLQFSKEPRPVYSKELDILGFDKYWKYDKDGSVPLMWAEANNYIYRGRLVAKTKGGSFSVAPELILVEDPEPNNTKLTPINISMMVEKNRKFMESYVQDTIKKIYNTYISHKNKVDVFYVAFSGGKDSIVTLDLVQKALPHNEFLVLFGDTMMEFPETYEVVEKTKKICEDLNIRFYTAKSRLTPEYTWNRFGPPGQKLRWCCSVHKTAPQILKLREITGKSNFRGMGMMGVRSDESVTRSKYQELNYGTKHQGQYDFYPILNWNSAELFVYIFQEGLIQNETYKSGNSRAGCLVCPNEASKNTWFKQQCYCSGNCKERTTTYFNDIILKKTIAAELPEQNVKEFMEYGVWRSRHNGQKLINVPILYNENETANKLSIHLYTDSIEWREWFKTLGKYLIVSDSYIEIEFQNKVYGVEYVRKSQEQIFSLKIASKTKLDIDFISCLKNVLQKAAYCLKCQVCEANCPHGFIHMNNKLTIDDSCYKCRKCHDINKNESGCLMAISLKLPKEKNKMDKSIDRYKNMGVRYSWISSYFKKGNDFWNDNDLGSMMVTALNTFLGDAEISIKKRLTSFGELVARLGIDSESAWGLILSNLAYSSQFKWWIDNIDFNVIYSAADIRYKLDRIIESDNTKKNIISGFKNILSTNDVLANIIGLGYVTIEQKGKNSFFVEVIRKPWANPIPEVVLYSLYKFAEACGDYKQFTLTRLMDKDVESDGETPVQIFGIGREQMTSILKGLAVNYPDYINVSFTLDLDNITLKEDKSSKDVLSLF